MSKGAGEGPCGTQLCQVNQWGDLMPEKCHTMDSFGSFPKAQLINQNTKACKVMQMYFSKRAAKGFKTLLFWLLTLPGGKCSYSSLEGPLKRLLNEASSFLLLLDIASSFQSSSSLSQSEQKMFTPRVTVDSVSLVCLQLLVRASLAPRYKFWQVWTLFI